MNTFADQLDHRLYRYALLDQATMIFGVEVAQLVLNWIDSHRFTPLALFVLRVANEPSRKAPIPHTSENVDFVDASLLDAIPLILPKLGF